MSTAAKKVPPSAPRKSGSRVWLIIGLLAVVIIGVLVARWWSGKPPSLPFAPYGEAYATKTDFARVEHDFPLTAADRMKLTPQNIQRYNQEQVDQIYARLTAGPIPDGPHDGDLWFPTGVSGKLRVQEILGGVPGMVAAIETEKLKLLGRALWKGKVFYRKDRILRNRIDDLNVFASMSSLFPNPDEEAQVRALTTNGKTDNLYFPAKLYCGQSLMDSRKESVIIDYAFTDEIEGYHAIPDKLGGREGLLIRDEIRMVRPGFYLGRAYALESFLLNFTVYNDAAAKAGSDEFLKTGKVAEDCWTGPQTTASN
jgi:hypothetical protein